MQRIPIGLSNFDEIRSDNYYFVDKSMFIAEVVRSGAKVIQLSRPRRFGKTLNLNMLKSFYSLTGKPEAFEGLAVHDHPDVMAHCGLYPTIFLTFKDVKHSSFEACISSLKYVLGGLFLEHEALIQKAQPRGIEAKWVAAIMDGNADMAGCQNALALLSKLLRQATGRKVVILIDEYDMPIHAGYHHGYYDQIIEFMRNLLSGAYKDNNYLEKGVLTGILRVAKESIFSGFNNSDAHTLLDNPFSKHFGFTWDEVNRILSDISQEHRADAVREWYNGYRIGDHTMYNPWSIMKVAAYPESELQPYWVNTSDNQLIKSLITRQNAMPKADLEALLQGKSVQKRLETDIVLGKTNASNLWSMLVHSGYLTSQNTTMEDGAYQCELVIPNREVQTFFRHTIQDWSNEQTGPTGLSVVIESLLAEDMPRFAHHFSEAVRHVLSYHDTAGHLPERVYHVFLLGMLATLQKTFLVRSNRESGLGRYDLSLIPRDPSKTGYVFEFKQAEADLQNTAKDALQQIRHNDYGAELRQMGVARIRAVGVAMCGKQAFVETALLQPIASPSDDVGPSS